MDIEDRAECARKSIRQEINSIETADEPKVAKGRADALIQLSSDLLLISTREWLLFMDHAATVYRGRMYGGIAA